MRRRDRFHGPFPRSAILLIQSPEPRYNQGASSCGLLMKECPVCGFSRKGQPVCPACGADSATQDSKENTAVPEPITEHGTSVESEDITLPEAAPQLLFGIEHAPSLPKQVSLPFGLDRAPQLPR